MFRIGVFMRNYLILFLDGRDCFAHEAWIVTRKLLRPEVPHEGVFHLANDPRSIVSVGEQAIDAQQGSVGAIEKCCEFIVGNVFQTRPPPIAPDAFECGRDPGSDQMTFVGRNIGQQVRTDREVEVFENPVVERVDSPFVAGMMMGGVADPVDQRGGTNFWQ